MQTRIRSSVTRLASRYGRIASSCIELLGSAPSAVFALNKRYERDSSVTRERLTM